MTVEKPLYNNKGRQYAKLFVPSKGEKELFKNMHELKEQLEETKQLNQAIKEKLNKL